MKGSSLLRLAGAWTLAALLLAGCADDGNSPPAITTHPSDLTVTEGETASFAVVATGSGLLTYQWYKSSVAIPGATLSTYTAPPTTLADDGAQFLCVVANEAGSLQSNAATLTVTAGPVAPAITAHPADQTVTEGDTATFTVVATGTAPLTYQWQRDGTDIVGAMGASHTTPAMTIGDSGARFRCVVTNALGSATSNPAWLTVRPLFADVGAGLTGVSRCSLVWGDYDNDGDLDLALAGNSTQKISKVYRNDAGAFTDVGADLTGVLSCPLAWGDYDNDRDLDLALAGSSGTALVSKVYRNDGGTFTDIGAGLTGVSYCSLAWGDYDNDGDLDLALAGVYYDYGLGATVVIGRVYRNNAGTFTDIGAGLMGVQLCSLAWGDYDNDGDLDLALAGGTTDISPYAPVTNVYRNDGGTFTDIGAALTGVYNCSLAWGDYDNDGDLDLALAGVYYDYGLGATVVIGRVYRNNAGTFTDIGAGLTGVNSCSLAWGDYDNDGDLDLALAGRDLSSNKISKVYRNDSGMFTDVGAGLTGVHECSLGWGDYDNDGDLDLALAGRDASGYVSKVYRNDGGTLNSAPSAPAGLSASVSGSDVTFSWSAATDAETPSPGLTCNLRVGTSPGGDEIMSGMAIDSPDTRLLPAMGNVQQNTSWTVKGLATGTYYWSVQAIDTAFCGGAWAEETVTVP